MLRHDRRNAFGRWMFVSAAAYFLLHLYNILYMLGESENPAILIWRFAGSMGLAPGALPLFAALPAAAAFAQEWNSRFCVPAVLRAGRGRYIRSKILAAAVGGALAPALGKAAFSALLHALYRGDAALAMELYGTEGMIGAAFVGAGGYAAYFAAAWALQALAGAAWALCGLAFSAFVPNVLWTVCLPLILYRLYAQIFGFTGLPRWLNLTLLQDGEVGLSLPGALLAALAAFGVLGAAAAMLFNWRARRRLAYA